MGNSNNKKSEQLGMPVGTAQARLRKSILFSLLNKHEENVCYRCNEFITSEKDLSIEHKKAWLDNDVALFWDLENIAFSHLNCNIKDARRKQVTYPPLDGKLWCSGHKDYIDESNFGSGKGNSKTRDVSYYCRDCKRSSYK